MARGFLALTYIFLALAGSFLTNYMMLMGGTQGPIENGKFYVTNHGNLTEVTRETWRAIGVLEMGMIPSSVVGVAFFLLMIHAYQRGFGWYLRGRDYTGAFVVVVIYALGSGVASNILGP